MTRISITQKAAATIAAAHVLSGTAARAATAHQEQHKELELRASGGSIHLLVLANLKAELHAGTSRGSVRCDLPLQGSVKKRSIDAKVNGGGPKVHLHTSGGSVTAARR